MRFRPYSVSVLQLVRGGWMYPALLSAILLIGCSSERTLEQWIAEGEQAMAAGKFEDAERAFLEAMSAKPDDPRILGRLGTLFFNEGHVARGYTFIARALQELPEDVDLRLTFARASYSVGRTMDARTSARKILEARPQDSVALLLLAETCVTTRDNEEARRIIEDLRERHGSAFGYHLALGAVHRARGEFDQAELELRAALLLDPKSSAVLDQLARLHGAKGNETEAAQALEQAARHAPVRSPYRIKLVHHLIRTGKLEAAQHELKTILNEAPEYVPALLSDMKVAFEQRRYDDSAISARKILARDRAHLDAQMQIVAIKMVKRDLDGAIEELKRVEETHPRLPQVKYQLALAHLEKGDRYRAEENLNAALVLAPNHQDAIYRLAELHLENGKPAAAISLLGALVGGRPELRRGQILLAQAYRNNGDERQGIAVLHALVQRSPKLADNHYLLGLALLGVDRAQARRAFENTVALSENHWPAQGMLINDDLVSKRTAAALARADTLVQHHPGAAEAWLLRAKARRAGGDSVGAESDLRKVLDLDPNVHEAHLHLATLQLASGTGADAIARVAESAERLQSAGAFTQLGILHAASQDFPAARSAYEKALSLDDRFTPALNNLALLLSERLGETDRALELARRAAELAPGNPIVEDTLGWVFVGRGHYTNALPLLRSSAEKLPGEPAVLYHLAMAYYYLGQEDPARQGLEQTLTLGPDATLREDITRRLAVLGIDSQSPGLGARPVLETALQADAKDCAALLRIAVLELAEGRAANAAERLEQVVAMNPRSVAAILPLIDLYLDAVRNDTRAKELAKLARASVPFDGPTSWRLGRQLYRLGDASGAIALLQDAVRLQPQAAAVRLDLAQALYSGGQIAHASEAVRTLRQLNPEPAVAQAASELSAMFEAGNHPATAAAAVESARAILAKDPEHLPAQVVAAMALEHAGEFQAASKRYLQLLETHPQCAPAMRQLALLYGEQLGDDTKAEEYATRARSSLDSDADLSCLLGAVQFRRGDYTAAVRILQQGARQHAAHAPTQFYLGMSQFQLKNSTEAKIALQKALTLGLPQQEASEATRVLEILNQGNVVAGF